MANKQRKEFILCASIKFNGIIISGYRHSSCYKILKKLFPKIKDDELPTQDNQGFLTSENRYVSRSEAFKIAKENNQMWHKLHDDVDENFLASEDLYWNFLD